MTIAARRMIAICIGWLWGSATATALMAGDPCRIEVVEAGSGLPAPLVELRTVSHVRLVSDNAGLIAFDLPEGMGQETWFQVIGHGYEAPQDGFGQRGVRLTPQPGGRLRVEVTRTSIARRLGRITGSGLFAESQQLGQPSPVPETGVVGCDSVQTAEHRGKLFWIWGDTNLAHYPLGVFHATAATSSLMPLDSYDPPLALRLDYFRGPRGRPRGVAPMAGKGPTWLSGLVSLPDGQGQPRLAASYVKVEPPLTVWQKGLCLWNETSQQFERHVVIWTRGDPLEQEAPEGHAVFWRDPEGQRWLLFGNPFPRLQMPATLRAWQDPQTWRSLPTPAALRDAANLAHAVKPHSGSIAWNPHRQRWVAVFVEALGTPSVLGEVWFTESASPLGPWSAAVKVLSHEGYSFYNPLVHAELTPDDSPLLLFEGTYTTMFASAAKSGGLAPAYPQPTPRHEYNQILYSLDLDDPRIKTLAQDH